MSPLVSEILLPISLFLMMVGMGLSLTPTDFLRVASTPRAAIVCLLSMWIALPCLGFLVASTAGASSVLSVGIVLVATCPGGMFSNLLTHVGGGNLALSISLTSIASLAYVFAAPLWVGLALSTFLGGDSRITLPFDRTLAPLVVLVLLPVALGMVVRRWKAAFALSIEGRVKGVSSALILLIFLYLSWAQEDTLGADAAAVALPVIVLNLTSVAIAAVLALVTGLERPDAIAVVIEHAVRQEGTAIFIAATLLESPPMALPLMINSGVGMVIALSFLALFGGRVPWIRRLRAAAPGGA